MLKPSFNPGERPALPLAPTSFGPVPPTPAPAPRPFWQRFLERKFFVALLVSASGLLGFFSGAVPFSLNLVLWIAVPLMWWIGIEASLDWKRLEIPQVPGYADDVARLALEIGKVLHAPPESKGPQNAPERPPS